MRLNDAQTIYFSGIGGIGMSALARLLQADGKQVLGSDLADSAIIDALITEGIEIHKHQDGSGITDDVDLIVFTSAVPEDHPERSEAQQKGIAALSYFEAIAEYMHGFETAIAISGTHGKSTVTAMIANMLVNAGLDPTALVGSVVPEFASNARPGSKKFLVVEACEHNEHMLELNPNIIVLTNIEADHLDYYEDLEDIKSAFQSYVDKLPKDGILLFNNDDENCTKLQFDGKRVSYGLEEPADITGAKLHITNQRQRFIVQQAERDEAAYEMQVPGKFNVSNGLAVIALGRALGIEEWLIQKNAQRVCWHLASF